MEYHQNLKNATTIKEVQNFTMKVLKKWWQRWLHIVNKRYKTEEKKHVA